VAAYYFGAMCGCFIGGWCGDKFGRKKGVLIGSMFCLLGTALMAASTSSNMFIWPASSPVLGSALSTLSFYLGCLSFPKLTTAALPFPLSSRPTVGFPH
jgi:MFS family permease